MNAHSDSNCHDGQLDVLVCPGFHRKSLTQDFVRSLPPFVTPHIVQALPTDFLSTFVTIKSVFKQQSVVAVGFSAGVVGLVGALKLWQHQGGKIQKIFAIDGWGVPTLGLPTSRISHDEFTHWSSLPLGLGDVSFYADPSAEHLQMWSAPEQVIGWQTSSPTDSGADFGADFGAAMSTSANRNRHASNARQLMTAQDFLHRQLQICFNLHILATKAIVS